MRLDIYINYPGNCEEAFRFYEQYLEAKVTLQLRWIKIKLQRSPDI